MVAYSKTQPTVTFIIPTLNSGSVLIDCLQSINIQDYPKNRIVIYIIDGGSKDSTLKIAKLYNCTIYNNPLKTAESAKAIGIEKCQTDLMILVDSDNILTRTDWISFMIKPLISDKHLIGSEPWSYTFRPTAGFIERYCSLIGANDPYALIAKIYDRQNILSGHWTGLNLSIDNHQYYQSFHLNNQLLLPTIGANGTVYRTKIVKKYFYSNYFFDIDFLALLLTRRDTVKFAKVKIDIIHSYCEDSISKFYLKQLRRVTDLYKYQSLRQHPITKNNFLNSVKFCFYVLTIIPMFYDMMRGYIKKPDFAWLFHPLACAITLYTYGLATIKNFLNILDPIDRNTWKQ